MFSPTRMLNLVNMHFHGESRNLIRLLSPSLSQLTVTEKLTSASQVKMVWETTIPSDLYFVTKQSTGPIKRHIKIYFLYLYIKVLKKTFKPDSGDGSSTSNHFSADHSASLRHFTTSKVDGHFVIVISNQRHSEQQRRHWRSPATATVAATIHVESIFSKSANVSNGSSVNDTTSTTTASVGQRLHCAPKLCQQSATTTSTESIVRVPALQHR